MINKETASRYLVNVFIIAICLFLSMFIEFVVESVYYNYNFSSLSSDSKLPFDISDSALHKIKGEYSYGSRVGDTLSFYKYGHDELLVWKITNYGFLPMSKVAFVDKRLEPTKKDFKQFFSYSTLSNNKTPDYFLKFPSKIKAPSNAQILFDSEAVVDTSYITPRYAYASATFHNLTIISDHGIDVALFKPNEPLKANFMLLQRNHVLYLLLLYKTADLFVGQNDLFQIVRK